MNIEEFRDYCLSFPDVSERTPFDGFYRNKKHSLHTFFVREKMFCYLLTGCNAYAIRYVLRQAGGLSHSHTLYNLLPFHAL